MLRPKASASPAEERPIAVANSVQARLFERLKLISSVSLPLPLAKSMGHTHADLPWFPLHGQWGHNALPCQPHQFWFLDGINTYLSGKFKNLCKERQKGTKVREVEKWMKRKKSQSICEIIRNVYVSLCSHFLLIFGL